LPAYYITKKRKNQPLLEKIFTKSEFSFVVFIVTILKFAQKLPFFEEKCSRQNQIVQDS